MDTVGMRDCPLYCHVTVWSHFLLHCVITIHQRYRQTDERTSCLYQACHSKSKNDIDKKHTLHDKVTPYAELTCMSGSITSLLVSTLNVNYMQVHVLFYEDYGEVACVGPVISTKRILFTRDIGLWHYRNLLWTDLIWYWVSRPPWNFKRDEK